MWGAMKAQAERKKSGMRATSGLASEAVEMTAFEDFVTEEVKQGRSILGLYPATDEQTLTDFAAWRKKTGR